MAAVHRSGAPSLPARVVSTLLAAALTIVPIAVLLLSLSMRVAEALRSSQPQLVNFIPLPVPPPPPPPETSRPRPAHATSNPLPSVASPPAPAPIPIPLVPVNPLPAPAAAGPLDGTGAGSGDGPGNGMGGGGTGTGAPRPVRTPANWVVMPGNRELAPYDPPRARREHVSGQVLLSCRVLRTKRLADCLVVEESPRDYGFGKAALGASSSFQMNPPTLNGEIDERSRIEIPVAFNERARKS